jgi:PAS domain S-box-containing protein
MTDPAPAIALLRDSRLAPHATSTMPAWLWSADASRILWANAVGAAIFGAAGSADLAPRRFDGRDQASSQIARLAATLPSSGTARLERLRGFGGGLGRLLVCSCSAITLDGGATGVLIVAAEAAGPSLPLAERVRRLLDGADDAVAAFTTDGTLLYATAAARPLSGAPISLAELGAEALATAALASGSASGATKRGAATARRLGRDATSVVILSFDGAPAATAEAVVDTPGMARVTILDEASTAPDETVDAPSIPVTAAPKLDASAERRHPLRFVWQMDVDGRLTLGSDEFTEVIGARTATAFGRPWPEIAAELELDPDGHVARAVATRDTWSGITVSWPIDGSSDRLLVELSGLPVYDRNRAFRGYRGFGVCRDVSRISAVVNARRAQLAAALGGGAAAPALPTLPTMPAMPVGAAPTPSPTADPPTLDFSRPPLSVVAAGENVVPFRSPFVPTEPKVPALSPVERKAFRDLARELTARLKGPADREPAEGTVREDGSREIAPAPLPPAVPAVPDATRVAEPPSENRALLDRLPFGVLVYRLDRLLYANRAFLDWTGHAGLDALEEAGGLDSLFIETGPDGLGAADNSARRLLLTTNHGTSMPVEGRLFTIPWNGDSAMALTFVNTATAQRDGAAEATLKQAEAEAREARAVLEIASDGVVIADGDGRIVSVNPSAEILFGSEATQLVGRALADLFAPESQRAVLEYIARLQNEGVTALRNYGREVVARPRQGSMVPLYMAMGVVSNGTSSDTSNETRKICAVFRDITQWKRTEAELVGARRQAESASLAKSEFLAKVSHEVRMSLNSIIGFAEVMIDGRFGAIENERYVDYLRDIRASGQHVISLVNDLLDLSKIESGKLDLNFASVNLNVAVQHSVALMQPQANRHRIIIRSSLSPTLPSVVADARSVRQIVITLLSNSMKYTQPGGQVIISTALTDNGEAVLRVRDTGLGMNEKDLAIALEPFRQVMTSSHRDGTGAGLGLPLTKALAEANRANFSVSSSVDDGTLVQIAFPSSRVLKA